MYGDEKKNGRYRKKNYVGLLLALIIVCSIAGVYIDINKTRTKLKY